MKMKQKNYTQKAANILALLGVRIDVKVIDV